MQQTRAIAPSLTPQAGACDALNVGYTAYAATTRLGSAIAVPGSYRLCYSVTNGLIPAALCVVVVVVVVVVKKLVLESKQAKSQWPSVPPTEAQGASKPLCVPVSAWLLKKNVTDLL